jgi:hypothetical protein
MILKLLLIFAVLWLISPERNEDELDDNEW